jgi:hypothetical protein
MLHIPYRYRYFSRFMGFLSSHYNKSNNSSTNTLDQEESTIYLNLKSYYCSTGTPMSLFTCRK